MLLLLSASSVTQRIIMVINPRIEIEYTALCIFAQLALCAELFSSLGK